VGAGCICDPGEADASGAPPRIAPEDDAAGGGDVGGEQPFSGTLPRGGAEPRIGRAQEPLSRAYCEAQRDAILAVCASPATPPNLKAACVAAAWIGFAGCLRLPESV
jgi:hypothetical protein